MLLTLILCNLFVIIFTASLPNSSSNQDELDVSYWEGLAKKTLFETYAIKDIKRKAKNIILFVGDGMGVSTITPSRILKGQLQNKSGEEAKLAFEDFPNSCLIKTYNVNYQVPDSAGTATALLSGVKTNKGMLGVTAMVKRNFSDCEAVQKNSVTSIFKLAQNQGIRTGIVTTTRITHATPAAAYASIADREWEGRVPTKYVTQPKNEFCKDIARQLIENDPGKKLNVILGGGARYFYSSNYTDPISGKPGEREDGINLVEKWLEQKQEEGYIKGKYKFVNTREQFLKIKDDKEVDHLFGIFSHNHMSYDKERDSHMEPSLTEMTEVAINVLQKSGKGFLLLVEGGRIDHAHHGSHANLALYETVAFDKAIERTLELVDLNETLIVVTADHSHSLTMNGYPLRGNNIMGIAEKEDESRKPFTTLMYGNGPGHREDREDPSTFDTSALRYHSHAGIYLNPSHHGGEDVALYSTGPMSHLFRGTKEQSYVAHAIKLAACLGTYIDFEHCIENEDKNSLKFIDNSIVTLHLQGDIFDMPP